MIPLWGTISGSNGERSRSMHTEQYREQALPTVIIAAVGSKVSTRPSCPPTWPLKQALGGILPQNGHLSFSVTKNT